MNAEQVHTLEQLIAWYETLTPASVSRVTLFYAAEAHFVDPFNDVHGVAAIERIFAHMFAQVEVPRFKVNLVTRGDAHATLCWDFGFTMKGVQRLVPGATLLRFDAAGQVCEHRDYWDPAKEIYAHLPLLGPVLRWLARRLSAA